MAPKAYFVSNLTVKSWLSTIFPHLLRNRRGSGTASSLCYVIDGSRLSFLAARATAWAAGVNVEKFDFRMIDVRDETDSLISLRISHQDMFQVQDYIIDDPMFQDLLQDGVLSDRMPMFLIKNIMAGPISRKGTLWRSLFLIQACRWKSGTAEASSAPIVLFLERCPWLAPIKRYAFDHGVSIIPVAPVLPFRGALRRRLPRPVLNLLRFIRYRLAREASSLLKSGNTAEPVAPGSGVLATGPSAACQPTSDGRPLVAAEVYGQFNLERPDLHSDLFFWHGSSLTAKDLLLTFSIAHDPVDQQRFSELKRHGMSAVALNAEATAVRGVLVFPRPLPTASVAKRRPATGIYGPEAWQLLDNLTDYRALREYWSNLFDRFNVKVYTGWYKFDGNHCAAADALQDLGGISTLYQRSYQPHPNAHATISADIAFGYSQSVAETERLGNSNIRYHVATGYLGDHRFPLLRGAARRVRESLLRNGAQWITAFFDENTSDDDRWGTGHTFISANYAFLLEKVLSDPGFGLVVKPKNPNTLRRRLGAVAGLLHQAEATGRCYVFEGGALQGSHAPAEAALAADLVIHGHLCAATAGMEAALAGIPTLLLDREGWHVSPLYRLGEGSVVFTNWNDLWDACIQHWSTPEGMPGFGDWSSMLDELDPFRDGRAAERMGNYLDWLIKGFQAGMNRETIMADAAERYTQLWGKDKVTQINSTWPLGHGPGSPAESEKVLKLSQSTPGIESLPR